MDGLFMEAVAGDETRQ